MQEGQGMCTQHVWPVLAHAPRSHFRTQALVLLRQCGQPVPVVLHRRAIAVMGPPRAVLAKAAERMEAELASKEWAHEKVFRAA